MIKEEQINIAFCWYQPDEWQKLKEIAEDASGLDNTYEEWRSNATKAFNELKANGINVQKVNVKLKELEAWCQEKGIPLNGEARSNFASFKIQTRKK